QAHTWRDRLEGIVAALAQYPHVAAVFSIRDVYARSLALDELSDKLPIAHHYGYQSHTAEAVDKYFSHYNIAEPDVPDLHPEFANPLFLHLFCRALAGEPDPQHLR